ncbi:MAG: hypothetical protein H7138_00065 [Myxococcales bacterium]|nr:hypothetical protein [Myxococcales bacterium]
MLILAGCADVPQPFDLDHPRVMAVRIDPPSIAFGESARVDVLITDPTALPHVADPATVTISAPGGMTFERDAQGWRVIAAAMVDVIVPIAVTVETSGGVLVAEKSIAIGAPAANPAAPVITLDGEVRELTIASGRDALLAVTPSDPLLSYRWFSSVGDLTGYTRAEASLEPLRGTIGTIVVVVRDQAGGTAWTIAPAEVLP